MSNLTPNNICFFYLNSGITLKDRNKLKVFIAKLLLGEGKKLESLNYIFCSDKYLLAINQDYLHHDFYTDIITFDLSTNNLISGEIYISLDRVRDNANSLNTSLKAELHRVIFHGALHLCGYKDKNVKEQAVMRRREEFYLQKYFNQL